MSRRSRDESQPTEKTYRFEVRAKSAKNAKDTKGLRSLRTEKYHAEMEGREGGAGGGGQRSEDGAEVVRQTYRQGSDMYLTAYAWKDILGL